MNKPTRMPRSTPTKTPPDNTVAPPKDLAEPQPEPQQTIPLALALPQQTRRVREAVLPFWYYHQAPNNAGQADPAVADYIQMVNAALAAADHAMMTQDTGLMQFAFRTLSAFDRVPATSPGAAGGGPTAPLPAGP